MIRMVMQLLVEARVASPKTVLDALDVIALATEEYVAGPEALPEAGVQLQEIRIAIEALGQLPNFRNTQEE